MNKNLTLKKGETTEDTEKELVFRVIPWFREVSAFQRQNFLNPIFSLCFHISFKFLAFHFSQKF